MNTLPNDFLRHAPEPPFFYKENFYFSGYSEAEGQELWRADPAFSNQEIFLNIHQSGWGFNTYTVIEGL